MLVNSTEKLNNDLLACQGLVVFTFLLTGPDMWDKKIL